MAPDQDLSGSRKLDLYWYQNLCDHLTHSMGSDNNSLKRELGLIDSISIVMGIMIGSGIFLMAGSVARQLESIAAVVCVWVVGGILSLCGALSLSELGAMFPEAGGLYVYLGEIYGPALAFMYGWSSLTLIHAGSIATMAVAVAFYTGPLLGLSAGGQKLEAALCVGFFTVVNCLGVALGKTFQNVLAFLKIAGLSTMALLLYAHGNVANLTSHLCPNSGAGQWSGFMIALIAVLWAFDGWHVVSFAAGEIKDAARTLPRALLIGTLATTAIYLVSNIAYYAVLSPNAIRATDRVAATAVAHEFGPGAGLAISLLITISILGAINGVVFGAPRVNWAMAHDGIFFSSFAEISPRFKTPLIAIAAQGLLAMLFTQAGTFQQLFTSYIFTAWIFYGLCALGVILLRVRRPEQARPYRCPLYPVTPAVFVFATMLIVISTLRASFWQAILGIALVLTGLPLYFLFKRFRRGGEYSSSVAGS